VVKIAGSLAINWQKPVAIGTSKTIAANGSFAVA
jgi:hypothetical protein